MMIRPLFKLMTLISLSSMLLTTGACLWGRQFPSPLLAYAAEDDIYQLEVMAVNHRLSVYTGGSGVGNSLVWSTDGRLALESSHEGNWEIYIWDGISLNNVSQNAASDNFPSWSVDGRLAFMSERDGNWEIYVWDGISLNNVSQNAEYDSVPMWNGDGRLAFVSERDGNREIYAWDGQTLTNLTKNPTRDEIIPALWTP